MSELVTTVEALAPDVIGVTESWGTDDMVDAEFMIPGYNMFRADRGGGHRGGGVLLLVNSAFNAVEVKLNNEFTDQVWCKVTIRNGEDLLLGVCYRSPNPQFSDKDNNNALCKMIEEVHDKAVILMGDFNYPDIDWSSLQGQSRESQQFVDYVEENFWTQHVTEGTCNGALLDLIFTSEPDMVDTISVLSTLGNSDHNMLEWDVHLSPVISVFNRTCFNYNDADYAAIREALRATDWSSVFQGDANEKWLSFITVLKKLESQYVPLKKLNQKRKKAPWMTHKAIKSVKLKQKLYRKHKNVRHPAYVKAARAAAMETRRAKRGFERKLAANIDTDRKSFYAYARSCSKARVAVGPLVDDQGTVRSLPQEQVQEFNSYFTTVFNTESLGNIPEADRIFQGSDAEKLCDIVIDSELVRKKFDRLRPDKASRPDDVSPRILIELKDEICYPVAEIMKTSFESGIVPVDWKLANVTPIYKKGGKSCVENYRPVSLTSQVCKLFELIVRDALTDHLDMHSLIRPTQHGFRTGKSCLSNLLEFLDHVTNSLESHDSVDVIYLDFAKAFDKVPHLRLLEKIDKHGIHGKVRRWLQEWLSGRRQRVCLNGHASSWAAVTSGVPQGSVLGPILFLIYINDLDSHIVSSILKFADDTKLFSTVNNDNDRAVLQSDLHKLLEWSDKWQMPFSISKCKVMHLGRNNTRFRYVMDSHLLEEVSEEKILVFSFVII